MKYTGAYLPLLIEHLQAGTEADASIDVDARLSCSRMATWTEDAEAEHPDNSNEGDDNLIARKGLTLLLNNLSPMEERQDDMNIYDKIPTLERSAPHFCAVT